MGKRIASTSKKLEYSKALCTVAFVLLTMLGCWMIWKYYSLMKLAIVSGSSVMPDASLPIAGISAIITPIVGYLLYQAKLKDSRNKYGISENGVPYVMPGKNGGE